MGRTIRSFRIASVIEQNEWKAFRKCLDKSDRKIGKICCIRGILAGLCIVLVERAILLMVTGDIKVALMVSTGIRVPKAIAKCVLSNGICCVKYQ